MKNEFNHDCQSVTANFSCETVRPSRENDSFLSSILHSNPVCTVCNDEIDTPLKGHWKHCVEDT